MEFIREIDVCILRYIHTVVAHQWLDVLCPILRNKMTWIPLYFYLLFIVYKKFERESWKIVLMTIVLISMSDLLCAQILKPIFHRLRPCQIPEFSSWLHRFVPCSQTFSLPSCHAMNHATLASLLFPFMSKSYGWLLVLWVLIICFSQVYIGVHFPSDVLAGIMIGTFIGWAGSRWISPKLLV